MPIKCFEKLTATVSGASTTTRLPNLFGPNRSPRSRKLQATVSGASPLPETQNGAIVKSMNRHRTLWTIICMVLVAASTISASSTSAAQPVRASSTPHPNGEPQVLTATQTIEIGAFVDANPPTGTDVSAFEALSNRHLHTVMWYEGWDSANPPAFPAATLTSVRYHDGYNTHTILHLTLEPWVGLTEITNGTYDAQLAAYAADVKDWGDPVRIRFAHEMIQDNHYDNCQGQPNCPEWYPWQDQPTAYINAFRHVHDIFDTAEATNATFIWCPNHYPFDINVVKLYYPGPDYVDWLCMDGYNWTDQDGVPGWPDWQWFDDIFYNLYHTFIDHEEIFGDKPVMIGEFASCEAGPYEADGETKAAWITDAFGKLLSGDYAKIQAFHWFHINKECNWRVDSSPESLAAWRDAIRPAAFTSHFIPTIKLYLPVLVK